MAENKFFDDGIEGVKVAIQADTAGNYPLALAWYQHALQHFMSGLQHETNQAKKNMILQRVTEYMERAEQLKQIIQPQASSMPAPPTFTKAGTAPAVMQNQAWPLLLKQPNISQLSKEEVELRDALLGAVITGMARVCVHARTVLCMFV